MGDELMKPQEYDSSITIPVTFDYRGGRQTNIKGKAIATTAIIVISIIIAIGVAFSDLSVFFKLPLIILSLYIGLFILRFIVFKELHFSDVYEELLAKDFKMDMSSIWQIFEISEDYPYITYFKNGQKGLFVRMEMGTITGKSDTVMYDHYEAISDAYNLAHSLNMNIIHIDYMDNVGNDERLRTLYQDLYEVKNPEMRDLLLDIYDNIREEMTRNYANYDIYLFLTRDRTDNFVYNVQNVCSKMIEGNFITYKIMDSNDIATTVKALFNLHEFSVLDANEKTLAEDNKTGIIPIRVYHADGTIEEINKTQSEQRLLQQERSRRLKDEINEKKAAKKRRKRGRDNQYDNINIQEQVNLFSSLDELSNQQGQLDLNNSMMQSQQLMQQQFGNNMQNNFIQQQNIQFNPMQSQQGYAPSQQIIQNGQDLNNMQNNNFFNNQNNN